MAREEIVTVIIDKNKETVKIEADGFVGEGCNVLNDLEMSLGTATSRVTKDEAFQYQLPDIVPNYV